jgi:hypothetical protein
MQICQRRKNFWYSAKFELQQVDRGRLIMHTLRLLQILVIGCLLHADNCMQRGDHRSSIVINYLK